MKVRLLQIVHAILRAICGATILHRRTDKSAKLDMM